MKPLLAVPLRLAFTLLAACVFLHAESAPLDVKAGLPPAGSAARGSFRSVLRPHVDLPLSSRAAGVVDKVHLPEGSVVKAGQPIITLDADQEEAEVAQVEASIRGTQAEVDRTTAELERAGKLRDINSEKQFVDAKAQAAQALSRHEYTLATLRLAKVRLANRSIISPIDGILLKTNKLKGESVDRYETVARIIDPASLEMTVFCDAGFFSKFRTGQRVEIRVVKSPEEQPIVSGSVIHTDPIIDPSSGTFRVKIKIDPSVNSAAGYPAFLIAPNP